MSGNWLPAWVKSDLEIVFSNIHTGKQDYNAYTNDEMSLGQNCLAQGASALGACAESIYVQGSSLSLFASELKLYRPTTAWENRLPFS